MSTQGSEWSIPSWTPGDRFRKARETAGHRQAPFADLIGVSARTIGKYENDEVEPRKIVVNAWALATGVPVEWLLYGVTPTGPNDDGTTPDLGGSHSGRKGNRTARVHELRPAARGERPRAA